MLLLLAFISRVSAWDISNERDRHGCQALTRNPVEGCDEERTVFVDSVGADAEFKTVQSGEFWIASAA